MTTQLLFNKVIGNVLAVEIAKTDSGKATITVRNDVKIDREIRTRPHFTGMLSTNIPDTAHVLFNSIIKEIERHDMPCGEIRRTNLPNLPPDQTHFSAEATVDIGSRSDEVIRALLAQAVTAAEMSMAEARFRRKVGEWTDRKGGRAAGLE